MRSPGLLEKCGPDRHNRIPENRKVFKEFAERNGWDVVLPEWSLTIFPKHPTLDGDAVSERAMHAGIVVTPGRFFGDKNRVRISFTTDPVNFRRLLGKLEEVLN